MRGAGSFERERIGDHAGSRDDRQDPLSRPQSGGHANPHRQRSAAT